MKFNIEGNLYKKSGIYSITTSIDNRFYIGSTINFWRRYSDHHHRLKNKNHANKYLQAFSDKYGVDKLSFNILYPCKNTCLVFNEKLWIELLKPQFNLKRLVTRPYFEDEVTYNIRNVRSPLENIMLESGLSEEEFKVKILGFPKSDKITEKRDPIPDLNVFEELDYHDGIPPSCPYPQTIFVEKEKVKLSSYRKERNKQLDSLIKSMRSERH